MASPPPDPLQHLDPDIAVDRALRPADRALFTEQILKGRYAGAQPADWISEAHNADHAIELVGDWWRLHGEPVTAAVADVSGLPPELVRRIVVSALYAMIGAGRVRPGISISHLVHRLAERASLWARGYAEATGWSPDTPAPAAGGSPHIRVVDVVAQAREIFGDRVEELAGRPLPESDLRLEVVLPGARATLHAGATAEDVAAYLADRAERAVR